MWLQSAAILCPKSVGTPAYTIVTQNQSSPGSMTEEESLTSLPPKTSVKTQQPTWKYLILSVDSFVQLTKFFNSNSYVHELGGPRNQTLLPVCSLCIISCKYCLNGQFCPTNCNFKHIQFTLISKGGKMRFRRGVTNWKVQNCTSHFCQFMIWHLWPSMWCYTCKPAKNYL